ncbi:MAG: hypothetical protein ACE5JG_00385 [Planctomycetota bacterium]
MCLKLETVLCAFLAFAPAGVSAVAQDGGKQPEKAGKGERPQADPPKPAGKPKGKGPGSMDELSKELFDSWLKKQYDLERAGAKSASCKVRVKFRGMTSTRETAGDYSWNGKSGSLTWDDPQLGGALAEQGWSAGKLDMWFKADLRVERPKGARFTATKRQGGVTIHVDHKGKQIDVKEIRFDQDGVLTSRLARVRGTVGGEADVTMSFRYEKVGGLYALSGWSLELEIETTKYRETTTITNVEAGGFFILKKAVADTRATTPQGEMRMRKTLTFSDWKINGKALGGEKTAAAGGREDEEGGEDE